MITPELVNYIQLRIAKGHHLDIIRKDLFAYGGWTHDDVDEVFKSVGVSEQDVPMASMESSVIKTGENKDEIISSQKPSYESESIQQAPIVNVDLGGDVSVSSEKEHVSMAPKQDTDTEEMSTVLDLDNDSLEQAGIESVTQNTPDSVNEKQMNDVSLSSPTEEIAGISFENPIKEMPAEEPFQSVVEEKTPVVMPPVQPVDSFDPRIQPASIAVKETLVQEPVMQNTIPSSTYIPEPTIVPVGMVQEKESPVPVMKTFASNIAPKPLDSVTTPKPAQNFAQEWYTKSEPVAPVVNAGTPFNPSQVPPAFGDMAITPDTQIHDDGVIIKKHNPVQKIIGITVIILLVLAIVGFGLYGYTQGLFAGFLNSKQDVEETVVVEIPMAEQALASLKNVLPINSGMQFSYVGSITSEKDIFQSLFFPMNNEPGEVVEEGAEEIVTEDMNAEIPAMQPVESLLSVDGWLRNGDMGIQSEGNITLEIPRASGMERVRMKFMLDQEFAYVSFGEASPEVLTHLNIEKDIWYRLPVIHIASNEAPLPISVQTIADIVNTVSDGLQSFVLENPGVLYSVMNLPMYQYPMSMQPFGEMITVSETDFARTMKNITGSLSLRENTFIPYNFSGSSNFDAMSVQHTLQLTPLVNNQITPIIPGDVQILFPELEQSVTDDENIQTENETEPLLVTEF